MTARARRRSWGSVTEVTRRKKYVIRWMENTPRGRMRRSKTIWGTYREACLELDKKHVEHAEDKPTPTVRRAYEMWVLPLLNKRLETGTLAPNSYKTIVTSWDKFVNPRWGDSQIDTVRAVDVQEWILTLNRGNAECSLRCLSRVFERAATFMPLPMNPFGANIKYEMPLASRTRSKQVYTLAQAEQVLEKLHGTIMEAPFILACFAGCRPAESLAVHVNDIKVIDVDGIEVCAVSIERQVCANGEVTERMKTKQSRRTTFVLPQAAQRLIQIRDEYVSQGREWLSDRGDGLPAGRDAHKRRWKKWCNSNDVEYIPWANLRNSWRTICEMELRMPWDLCELMMGHALPGMSGAHYIRPSIEQTARTFIESLGINKDIS